MTLSEFITDYRIEHGLSQRALAAKCSVSTGYISLIEKEINPQTGKKIIPTLPILKKLAKGMGITIDTLLASCEDMDVDISISEDTPAELPDNIIPMPKMNKVPLLGSIACGEPILAVENIESEVDIPDHIRADFALRCRGDSMINARIFDGDIVYIRHQPIVENGEIAAVLIGEEATLKRVRLFPDHIVLEPENPLYRPLVYWGEDMDNVNIIGLAVAFTGCVR